MPTQLSGKALRRLFSKGKASWNAWVAKNPDADIQFKHFGLVDDLSQANEQPNGHYFSFAGFDFPRGRLDFSQMRFGSLMGQTGHLAFANIDFSHCQIELKGLALANVKLSFNHCKFGNQHLDFSGSKLSNLQFDGSCFNQVKIDLTDCVLAAKQQNAVVSLAETKWEQSLLLFNHLSFEQLNIDCRGMEFSGRVEFNQISGPKAAQLKLDLNGANFNVEAIDFRPLIRLNAEIDFTDATFAAGHFDFSRDKSAPPASNNRHFVLNFTRSRFTSGSLNFAYMSFKPDRVTFTGCDFGTADVDLSHGRWKGEVIDFTGVSFAQAKVDFSAASFQVQGLDFSGANFGCGLIVFDRSEFTGVTLDFSELLFAQGRLSFNDAVFTPEQLENTILNRGKAPRGCKMIFDRAELIGSELSFERAELDAAIDFSQATIQPEPVPQPIELPIKAQPNRVQSAVASLVYWLRRAFKLSQ